MMFITSRTEKNHFLSNSTVAVVPGNNETSKFIEMLQQKLPSVDFIYFKVFFLFHFCFDFCLKRMRMS